MLGLASRLIVGGVWIVAGLLKLPDPAENVRAVRAYQSLPETMVPSIGYVLPVLELLLGVCLVVGLLTRVGGVLSSFLLVAFILGIVLAWARGLEIECGCFGGGGGPAEGAADKYPWEIARDAGLLLLSAYLVWLPRTRWSADNRLFPDLKDHPDGEEEVQGHQAVQRPTRSRARRGDPP